MTLSLKEFHSKNCIFYRLNKFKLYLLVYKKKDMNLKRDEKAKKDWK